MKERANDPAFLWAGYCAPRLAIAGWSAPFAVWPPLGVGSLPAQAAAEMALANGPQAPGLAPHQCQEWIMTKGKPMTTRDEFEAHMLSLNACTRLARQRESLGGYYRTTTVQRAWELWQAATKKEREACAVVCDEAEESLLLIKDFRSATEAAWCAEAIRARDKEQG